MNIDVIRTANDYKKALARINALTPGDEEVVEGSDEARELDVLTILVHHYERQHAAIEPPHPIEAIRFHIDQVGLTAAQLEKALGGAPRVSEVMNRRRPLSITMIRKLVALGVPAASLIGKIKLVRSYGRQIVDGGAKLAREKAPHYRRKRARSKK